MATGGNSGWQIVASPNAFFTANGLVSVIAFAATDVWAVGATTDPPTRDTSRTLVVHWNGQQWSVMPSPSPGMLQSLEGIAAVAPDDIWAVGRCGDGHFSARPSGGRLIRTVLIEHWDGQQWSVITSPDLASEDSCLLGVAGVSPSDVWAVGVSSTGATFGALLEHWNGRQWSVIPGAHPGAAHHLSRVVRVPGEADLWAVGAYQQRVNPFEGRMLIEKFSR